MNRDRITGIVGLVFSAIFAWQTMLIKPVLNAVEPGPKLMPILAITMIAGCSIALIITNSGKKAKPSKPYFPKGGIKKITIGFLGLVLYGVLLGIIGFIPTTPFATAGFIYLLKGQSKVNRISAVIVSILTTVMLYILFVVGFSIKLPSGIFY